MRKSFLLRVPAFILILLQMSVLQGNASDVSDGAGRQWADSIASAWTVDEKAGQLMVVTVPARADRQTKRLVRDLVKKYKVGGLIFKGGTAEEQAILTNLARKDAVAPLLVTTNGQRLSDCLSGVPVFPGDEALACIADQTLLQAYRQEMKREFNELGMVFDDSAEGTDIADWAYVVRPGKVAVLLDSLRLGKLSESDLDARCRKMLAYKHRAGLNAPQSQLQVSGLSFRINSEEAQKLARQLRQAAITVTHNYFNSLPLSPVEGGIAVLSMTEEGTDSVFVEALKKHTQITSFHLSQSVDEAGWQETARKLRSFRRIIINVMNKEKFFVDDQMGDFLNGLELQMPVVYTFFSPYYYPLLTLEPAVSRSSAMILAHSMEPDLQQYVADLLFAQVPAGGRLAVDVGRTFPAGAGCDILPGMKPGKLIPEDLGMKSYILHQVDRLARQGVTEGAYPGCRILVLKDGKAVYDKGFGTHSDKDTTSVRPTDLFDLSSLTMSAATVLAVMKLYDEGKLNLDDKISKYVPQMRTGNKANITLRDLLLHESGLPPHLRFYIEAIDPNSVHGPYAQSWEDQWHKTRISEHSYFCSDFKFKKGLVSSQKTTNHTLHMAEDMWMNKSFKNTILQQIARSDLEGRRYIYSQVGFILLQQVVEKLSGLPMDLYVAKEFYAPMGLLRTMFLPLSKYPKEEIMPTATNDFLRRQDLCGYVYDEAAACLGGVSGNAGLFSTAEELAKIYQMLLNGGEWRGKRYLSEQTCRLFTTETSQRSRSGLGFDRPDVSIPMRSPCAAQAPAAVFGQNGFSGTAVWADPQNDLIYVFLSNRQCPHAWNTRLADMEIIKEIQEVIYKSLIEEEKAD